ncbi:MAG: DinB family protein [Acidobacteria bacterium]|nr:DinB family protein [Acidobacteriota bacterium]
MNFHSIAEIYDSIDGTRTQIYRSVEGLSAEQERFRPAPGVWSIAEIVEHLSMIEKQLMHLFGMMTKKAEDAGASRDESRPFAPVSLDEFAERASAQKYTAPETARPTGNVTIAESLERLRESRAALQALRPRLEKIDGVGLQYPHPYWGPLNLYQWLAFVGAHEERHLRQLEAVKASPEFETAGIASS